MSRAVGRYLLLAAGTAAVLAGGLRLRPADLAVPFADTNDALLVLPLVKAACERGSHWRNERLGAPGVQELYDYPVVDHLHFAGVWLLNLAVGDPVVTFNLYHLLTYPLAAVTAAFALGRLGLSRPAAGCGGLLFAFLPYHHLRGEWHYFLSAYYVVPLTLLVTVWAADGAAFATRRRAAFSVAVAAATAAAGAYYAYFGCALLVVAAAQAVAAGTVRAAAGGLAVAALVVAGGLAQHLPTVAHQRAYGRNPAPLARPAYEAEYFGLKLVQLVLPGDDHRSRWLADLRFRYDSPDRPLLNENRAATLGLVGTAGLAYLLGVAVTRARPGWPVGHAAGLAVAAVLVGTVGGVGAVVAEVISPQVRAYNRISVYVAFLAQFAALRAIDGRLAGGRWGRPAGFAAVAVLGLWDQTPARWFTPAAGDDRAEVAARWRADADFFAAVEARHPAGRVLCLPVRPYPEDWYEHARGYLHTRAVAWSHGAVSGRPADRWLRAVAVAPADELVRRAALRGFDGIYYDPRGVDDRRPAPPLADVRAALGPPAVTHSDGRQAYFDLRPHRDQLRAELGDRYEAAAARESGGVSALWLAGFATAEPTGREDRLRWCGRRGELWLVNPADRPRAVRLTATFAAPLAAAAELDVAGGVWAERLTVTAAGVPVDRVLTVPPGHHRVTFTCTPADLRPSWTGEVFRVTAAAVTPAD